MRAIFLLLWVLIPVVPAMAGTARPAIVGSWDCVATDDGGVRTVWTLDVKQDGEKLRATLRSTDGDVIDLLDPEFAAPRFHFQVRINPTELVDVSLKLEGNRLDGRFTGKDSGTGSIQAVRREPAGVGGEWSGEWDIGPDGVPGPHYMVLQQDGDKVTGTAGPRPDRQIPIQNGKFAADTLTFDIAIPSGPSLHFEFKLDAGTLRGNALLKMDGVEQKLKLSAKRAAR